MPAKKSVPVISKVPFLIIELIGVCLAFYLFAISSGLIHKQLPCSRSKYVACENIVKGQFSHIGPISIAAMGVVYFVIQIMLTAGLRDRTAQTIKIMAVLAGVIFVAWLRSLELIYIKKLCPWCWGIALITLIHAGITYYLASPPMPRLKPLALAGTIFGGFIVIIGLVSVMELGLGFGHMLQGSEDSGSDLATGSGSAVEKGDSSPTLSKAKINLPAAIATPAATPKPKPKETPAPAPERQAPPTPSAAAGATPTPSPSPTPAAKATPTALDPEPDLPVTEETKILKKRGWRHAASGESVVKAVKLRPPVLMLAYDPQCGDCYALITKVLDNDAMNPLPVTRIAIQESMLSGQIDKMIKEMPTLILFGPDGTRLMDHVGSRITPEELAKEIRAGLAKIKK